MSDLKSGLQSMFDVLKGIETRARGLKNQNLADIAASAHGRVKQLGDHPDLELVDEHKDQQEHQDGTLKADPHAPGNPNAGAPFPHAVASGPLGADEYSQTR